MIQEYVERSREKQRKLFGMREIKQDCRYFGMLNRKCSCEILTKVGTLNKKAMIAKTRELFDSLGVDIDHNAMVSELETSKKQLLEIAKALFSNAKLLILDEPTTSLNQNEIDHLFEIVNRLK